jgi:S1-C subfamily serine protease
LLEDLALLDSLFDARPMTSPEKRLLQMGLAASGDYRGLLDGEWGRGSQNALERYGVRGDDGWDGEARLWHATDAVVEAYQFIARHNLDVRRLGHYGVALVAPSAPFEEVDFGVSTPGLVQRSPGLSVSVTMSAREFALGLHPYFRDKANDDDVYLVRKDDRWVTALDSAEGEYYLRSEPSSAGRHSWWTVIVRREPGGESALFDVVTASITANLGMQIAAPDGSYLANALAALWRIADELDKAETSEAPQEPLGERGLVPEGYCAVIVASVASEAAARQYLEANFVSEPLVYLSSNGLYAIADGWLREDERVGELNRMRRSGTIPEGAYCSSGAGFVEELSVEALSEAAVPPPPAPSQPTGSGTAFYVNNTDLVTARHVIDGCARVKTADGAELEVIGRHATLDLALLSGSRRSRAWLAFDRTGEGRLGQRVFAIGYPYFGLAGTSLNLTAGNVSAETGVGDDLSEITISAPVQPGNSGGPLLDADGAIIGVVIARLSPRATGFDAAPENVNYAVRGSELIAFLREIGVFFPSGQSDSFDLEDGVPDRVKDAVVPILCF